MKVGLGVGEVSQGRSRSRKSSLGFFTTASPKSLVTNAVILVSPVSTVSHVSSLYPLYLL